MTSEEQFDELVKYTDEWLFAAPFCDQPPDDIPISIQSEIQPILENTLVHDVVMMSEIVAPVHIWQDEYYEVFPLSVAY